VAISQLNPLFHFFLNFPNTDKPEQITTKAPRHKAEPFVDIFSSSLCVLVANPFFYKMQRKYNRDSKKASLEGFLCKLIWR
jgi:hypothetical protein